MITRAKTALLFEGKPLTAQQRDNSAKNLEEMKAGAKQLTSYPRRLVFELTNTCNLNCIMCGRNATKFRPTVFRMDWFHWFEPMMDFVEEVTLMGWGEPTIHPQFVEMLETIHRHTARIYFCTNGMRLHTLRHAIFEHQVDVFAVSVDGATQETNGRIRRGSDLSYIVRQLKEIEGIKARNRTPFPYINFVFCAMKSNLHELPDLVRLAANIGLDEVKVVYLTVFDPAMREESLWGCDTEVAEVFAQAEELAEILGITLKLPYVHGADVAGEASHRDCFVAWRDFFLGSDGFVRPCMSTAQKLLPLDMEKEFYAMWNSPPFQAYRAQVNGPNMDEPCQYCYQSSHCNWNQRHAFLQIGTQFSPDWAVCSED